MISAVKRLFVALALGIALVLSTAIVPANAAPSQATPTAVQTTSTNNNNNNGHKNCHWVKGHWEYHKGYWQWVPGHKEWVPGHWEYKHGHKHWVKGHNKWVKAHKKWHKGHKKWHKGHWDCPPPCRPYDYNCMHPSSKAATVSKNNAKNADFALRSAPASSPAGPDNSAALAGALGVALLFSGVTSVIVNRRRLRRAEH
jgi:hypothetical protein